MNMAIHGALAGEWIRVVGWVLVHFVWQGALLAGVFAIARVALARSSAHARYLLACGILALMAICPLATAWVLRTGHHDRAATWMTTPDTQVEKGAAFQIGQAPAAPDLVTQIPATTPVPMLMSRGNLLDGLEENIPWLVGAWGMGVGLLALRLALGWSRAARWGRQGVMALGDPWMKTLQALANRLGVRQSIALMRSTVVGVPMVVGWLRPIILVPVSMLAELSPAQIEVILAHELAHIRRHDALVNLFQCILETLLFYHPAVWWVSAAIRHEREQCCDDQVCAWDWTPCNMRRALLRLEEARGTEGGLVLTASGGRFIARIRRILAVPQPPRSAKASWAAGLLMILIFWGALYSSRLVMGDTPSPTPAPAHAVAVAPVQGPQIAATPVNPPAPEAVPAASASNSPTPSVDPPTPDSPPKSDPARYTVTTPESAAVDAEFRSESKADQQAQTKLQQTIAINFDANKLSSVMDYFHNILGLDFDVKWARLNDAHVDEGTFVTADFPSISAAKALSTILDGISPPTERRKHIEYIISNGTVLVSTHADLSSLGHLILHVYDVRDLLKATDISRLADHLYDNVGVPEDWRWRANGDSTIDGPNGNLLVRTTAKNHEEIRALLAMMRSSVPVVTIFKQPVKLESQMIALTLADLKALNLDSDMPNQDTSPISLKAGYITELGMKRLFNALKNTGAGNAQIAKERITVVDGAGGTVGISDDSWKSEDGSPMLVQTSFQCLSIDPPKDGNPQSQSIINMTVECAVEAKSLANNTHTATPPASMDHPPVIIESTQMKMTLHLLDNSTVVIPWLLDGRRFSTQANGKDKAKEVAPCVLLLLKASIQK